MCTTWRMPIVLPVLLFKLLVLSVLKIWECAFGWQHASCVFVAYSYTFMLTHTRTHPIPTLPFCFLGRTHLQPYYPESSAAARSLLCCWSVLLVTSAPSTRSAQLRSSGISPMENLLRIQKKPVHTSNCDRVFHLGSTALFSLLSHRMKCSFISAN